jgi:hypothetical protein
MNRFIAVTTADDIAPAYRNLMARRELFIGGLVAGGLYLVRES